jgi:hypothetical protein
MLNEHLSFAKGSVYFRFLKTNEMGGLFENGDRQKGADLQDRIADTSQCRTVSKPIIEQSCHLLDTTNL